MIEREWECGIATENFAERFSDTMTAVLVDGRGFMGRASRSLQITNVRVGGILRAYTANVR